MIKVWNHDDDDALEALGQEGRQALLQDKYLSHRDDDVDDHDGDGDGDGDTMIIMIIKTNLIDRKALQKVLLHHVVVRGAQVPKFIDHEHK